MKHIVWKAYWNYEKEEAWLNDMAAKGLALVDYSWCRYVFEERPAEEYIYRIELLRELPSHPESQAYLRFMEESGVQHVASYMRWVYFRKKASDGAFDIYTDIDSRIRHYQRINIYWSTLAFAELTIGLGNLSIGLSGIQNSGGMTSNFWIGLPLILIGIVFISLGAPLRRKIRKLKKEKSIHEA